MKRNDFYDIGAESSQGIERAGVDLQYMVGHTTALSCRLAAQTKTARPA
ncbi:hypothetical protein [Phyllobacterium chamaecytisi]|nr:hypothetical protein [Phyllobacterium sp. KW56]MBZ9603083.1 hypothetical protein [Phyllobacterium sp. KW56]